MFRNETEEWVHVKVNGEEITCTPMLRSILLSRGWTSAIDLRAGDILVMLNGEYVVVEQVQHELLESPETTYNFEVEDFHTYYVGDEPVLVHNQCVAKDGDFKAIVNEFNETEAPHAHIFA
ncbi:MAG: HINT domain-containing protein [Oscillospiraceae bacterium]|nr:MAG: HINT domain-containing protein [Oscillospiraceae bacterium]